MANYPALLFSRIGVTATAAVTRRNTKRRERESEEGEPREEESRRAIKHRQSGPNLAEPQWQIPHKLRVPRPAVIGHAFPRRHRRLPIDSAWIFLHYVTTRRGQQTAIMTFVWRFKDRPPSRFSTRQNVRHSQIFYANSLFLSPLNDEF